MAEYFNLDRILPTGLRQSEDVASILGRPGHLPTTCSCSHVSANTALPDEQVCVSIVADVPAVASLGAALTGIPPETAEEAASSGIVSDTLVENYAEICNILSTFFQVGSEGVEMKALSGPLAVKPHRKTNAGGRAMSAALAGYPKGTLVFH